MNGIKRALFLMLALICIFAAETAVYAKELDADAGEADETEEIGATPITFDYDEYNDLVIVHVRPEALEAGTGDLTLAFREAVRQEAALRIENADVTLVFDVAAARAVLESGEMPSACIYRVNADSKTAGNYILAGYTEEDTLYEISLSGIDLGDGSVSVTIDYLPESADNVRVLLIDASGKCTELDAKCKNKKVRFTTTELSTLLITEEPAVGGDGAIRLLKVLLVVLVICSVLFAGFLTYLRWSRG